MVLADALLGLADEAHAARLKIGDPAVIVEQFAVQRVGVERVDGEVAARGVLGPVGGEGDLGMAAVGVHVGAQRGDLDDGAVGDGGDRAMRQPGGYRLDARFFEVSDGPRGLEDRGAIEIVGGQAEQPVAHRTADEADAAVARLHRVQQPVHARAVGEGGDVYRCHVASLRARLTIIAAVAPQMSCPS